MRYLTAFMGFFRKAAVPVVASTLVVATPLVERWEGLRTRAYLDVVGIPTICFGETKGVRMGDVATPEECRDMLQRRLQGFEDRIVACAPEYKGLPVKTQAAILSMTYNIGSGAMCRSTLVRRMKMGEYEAMCAEMSRWNRAGGRVVQGLVNRRAEERKWCEEGLKE